MTTSSGSKRTIQTKHGKIVAKKKNAAKRNGIHAGGRPTDYRKKYSDQARKLCMLLGATDLELAEFFEVDETTINRWKRAHAEFRLSIRKGKLDADTDVVTRLYDRAVGMKVQKTHITQYQGKIIQTKYEEEIPPDVKAVIFWLKNRQKGNWRDVFAHTDGDGGAFSLIISHELHPDDRKHF